MLGTKAGLEDLMHVKSWKGLKQWVADHWVEVIDVVRKRLESVEVGSGFDLAKALEKLEGLRNELDDDKIAREVVGLALLLIQAERLGVNETTLRYFGAVVSGAVGGDGHVSAASKKVELTSGKRAVDLFWSVVFAAYGIKAKVEEVGGVSRVVTSGGDAARLAGLYFLYGAPLLEGDDRLKSHKLAEAVKLGAGGLDIRWEGLRRTEGGLVAADLIISVGGIAVKYNVYLGERAIVLQFESTDRSRAELAARRLKLAGVNAEVRKESDRDAWYVKAYTDMLAAGRGELREALVKIVETARSNGWVDAGKAERWLNKLRGGLTLKEGWPRYGMSLTRNRALWVRFSSPNPDSIQQEAQRLREMGLEEGRHFSVKMPEGGKAGYVYIRREGLAYAAWLSVHGKDEDQRELAAEFVKIILQRAREACGGAEQCAVYEKVKEIIEEGMLRSSLKLKGFEMEVEVNGKKYVVKVIDGDAKIEEGRGGRKLLRIKITAEVGGVRSEYTITFGRYGKLNAVEGHTTARADAPGGREADAERFSTLVEALTGKRPRIRRKSDGTIELVCGREHLNGFRRYKELADTIEKWLERV
jgi:hypothetical protein